MRTVGSSLVIVSWLPPSPANGLLTSYSLRVLLEPSGTEVFSRSLPLSPEQQDTLQTVSVPGLNLDTMRYRVLVSATNNAGTGPDSTPILIGTEATMATTEAPPTTTPPPSSSEPTMPATPVDTTDEATGPLPSSSSSSSLPETTPTATPMATLTLSTTTGVVRDEVYYVIRVVPPVVGGFLLLGLCLAVLLCCLHRRTVKRRKKGLYRFHTTESDYQ